MLILSEDDWEIPFEMISDLQWLGSGAQGAVFSGMLKKEIVAVKKVRETRETDIKHLRKLNHQNIVKFRGVCTQAPCYCIIMEYCPYGPLYDLLRAGEPIPPPRLVSWSKQIAAGMAYLHAHKIIHRDLKSPNVLIGRDEVVKISDFGTSREWNEISTKMSFAGTVAWMAPEIIRNEPCSEKVDIWSYGIVLWELLSGEIPYKDVDSSAIIWGVGNNSLHLPIPVSWPEGYQLLVKQCWSEKPKNRPSFGNIELHLGIAAVEVLATESNEYFKTQQTWKDEIRSHMKQMQTNSSNGSRFEADLIRRREDELRHAQDIREHYEKKLERTNNLYLELSTVLLQLEQRERDIIKKEQQQLGYKMYKKRIVHPLLKAQERLHRKRCNTQYHNHQQQTSSSTSTTPSSSLDSPQSPVKSILRTQVNKYTNQLETVIIPNNNSFKQKKYRHRRVSSSNMVLASPRWSPHYQRDSGEIAITYVDQETQTNSPINFDSIEPICFYNHEAVERIQDCSMRVDEHSLGQPDESITVDDISDSLINGNPADRYTDEKLDKYASPDIKLKSHNNNRPRDCSDDDHLERLGRKVSEIINANRLLPPVDNGNCENIAILHG